MSVTSSMFMYSLTLKPPSMITQAIIGQFISDSKEQQVAYAQGDRLNLGSVDKKTGEFRHLLNQHIFGIIRRISTCRIPGTPNDLLLVSSDSGRIAVLKHEKKSNRFERVHLETYGKSGVRRTIPGQYLATDPRGRCCMFASAEKNKVVYILNRNQEQEVTISSPQEVNQPQTLTFDLCAVDTNFQNPVFAALEVNYTDIDQDPTDKSYSEREKLIVHYRVDLGLNHVVREWADTVDYSSNIMFACPGGSDGPGGVLVCGLEVISYRQPSHDVINITIPRRRGATEDPRRKRRVVSGVMHRLRGDFFLLVQTDDGDVFKLSMILMEDDQGRRTGEVEELQLVYFDTFPIATNLCILKTGYLFLAVENGDSHIYRFTSLGNEIEPVWSSKTYEENLTKPIYFLPHEYENVELAHSLEGLNPQKHTVIEDLEGKDEVKIITTAGTGNRSSLKTITHGLRVQQHANAALPEVPSDIWAVPQHRESPHDKYLIITFANVTMFLEVGAETKEVHDHGLRADVPTVHMGLLGDEGLLQVWDRGFRFYTGPKNPQPDWQCPPHRTILKACSNHQQLCIALSSGELLYFEVAQNGMSMQEYDQGKDPVAVNGVVMAMSMGEVPEGRVRAPFLVVGTDDSTIRVFGLDPNDMLSSQSVQSLTSAPRSIEVLSMTDSTARSTYVHVGLFSGVYLRAVLDDTTGELGNVRSRFLGAEEVKLKPVTVNDRPVMLACSTRTFMSYPHPETGEFLLTPLAYLPLHAATAFRTELFGKQSTQLVAGLHRNELCVFVVKDLAENTLTNTVPLQHTPRGFCRHPNYRYFHVIQSDPNTLDPKTIKGLLSDESKPEEERKEVGTNQQFRWPRGNNYWSSCIQVVDPLAEDEAPAILDTLLLEDNEAALCCAMVPFDSKDGQSFLLVGTGKNIPVSSDAVQQKISGFVHVYEIQEQGTKLAFRQKTEFEKPILALLAFQGRVLIGVGRDLFIHDMGQKSLLRKSRCRVPGSQIVSLNTQGARIVVGDVQESVFYVVYKHAENKLIPFADDSISRWTTTTAMVDYDTVAGGDKFGNIWIVRCPKEASEESDEPGSGNFLAHEKGYLGGTPHRLMLQVHNYCQDIPTTIQKTSLVPGGQDVLFWAGLQGTLGILVPFVDREDVEFFTQLEAHLRADEPPLAGRDHLMYRSYYAPVKGCVDGDLCERYFYLSHDNKARIAAELERDVREVEKKVGEMRTRVAW